jgi:hypothetical protein
MQHAWKMSNAYIIVRKPKGKRPLRRSKHTWKDNTKLNLKEIGYMGVDWINLAQDTDQCEALMNTVMNLWVP